LKQEGLQESWAKQSLARYSLKMTVKVILPEINLRRSSPLAPAISYKEIQETFNRK
jgi:hypothetical protein